MWPCELEWFLVSVVHARPSILLHCWNGYFVPCLSGINGWRFSAITVQNLEVPSFTRLTGNFLQWKCLQEADSLQTSCHLLLICEGARHQSSP